jgi:hypothetical protein
MKAAWNLLIAIGAFIGVWWLLALIGKKLGKDMRGNP